MKFVQLSKIPPKWAMLIVALLISFSIISLGFALFSQVTKSPSPETPSQTTSLNRIIAPTHLQELYRIQSQAAHDGWNHDLHHSAGNIYRNINNLPDAVAHWENAQLTDAFSVKQLAQAYIELQRWADVIQELSYLLEIDSGDSWAHYQLALILSALDPSAAENHLREASLNSSYRAVANVLLDIVLEDMTNPLISIRVGLVLLANELAPQAELAFRHASIIGHPYPEALAYTGLARITQGKEGVAWMEQALIYGSDSGQVQYLHGLYLRGKEDYENSRLAFSQATTLEPDNPVYYAELSSAYRLLDDYQQAEHWLLIAVSVSGDAPEFHQLLATFYAQYGNNLSTDSLGSIQAAGEHLPPDPTLLSSIGWALYTMGDIPGALAKMDAALAINPYHPQSLYYKVGLLIELGLAADAFPLLERLAAIDSPYKEWATDILQELEQPTE
jgi:tetratricopeptide (TPR) repeat protein